MRASRTENVHVPSAKNSEWNPAKNVSQPSTAMTASAITASGSHTAPANRPRRTPPGLVRSRDAMSRAHTTRSTTSAAAAIHSTVFTSVMWSTSTSVNRGAPWCVRLLRYRGPARLVT